MLRLLVLPAAVATVLAASACASGEAGPAASTDASSASSAPPSSAAPSTSAAPSSPAPSTGATPGSSPSAGPGASESEQGAPDALHSTDAAMQGDPGEPGLPAFSGASIDDVLRLGAVASWIERPERIALSLPASPSCWATAAEPIAESPTRIRVHMSVPEPCEAPNGARTYVVTVPEGIDTGAELQLAVVGLQLEFTLTLPAG